MPEGLATKGRRVPATTYRLRQIGQRAEASKSNGSAVIGCQTLPTSCLGYAIRPTEQWLAFFRRRAKVRFRRTGCCHTFHARCGPKYLRANVEPGGDAFDFRQAISCARSGVFPEAIRFAKGGPAPPEERPALSFPASCRNHCSCSPNP